MPSVSSSLHEWGAANQVEFDLGKESITILSRQTPFGEIFSTLGAVFDQGLYMQTAITAIADVASWKLRTLLQSSRFYSTREMVHLLKSKIWSYIECKAAAIYHADSTVLEALDKQYN